MDDGFEMIGVQCRRDCGMRQHFNAAAETKGGEGLGTKFAGFSFVEQGDATWGQDSLIISKKMAIAASATDGCQPPTLPL